MKKENLRTLIKEANQKAVQTKELTEQIAEILQDIIAEFIPDIKCGVGWEGTGVNTICLKSDENDVLNPDISSGNYKFLDWTLEDYFPVLNDVVRIYCPISVYIHEKDIEPLVKKLSKYI